MTGYPDCSDGFDAFFMSTLCTVSVLVSFHSVWPPVDFPISRPSNLYSLRPPHVSNFSFFSRLFRILTYMDNMRSYIRSWYRGIWFPTGPTQVQSIEISKSQRYQCSFRSPIPCSFWRSSFQSSFSCQSDPAEWIGLCTLDNSASS